MFTVTCKSNAIYRGACEVMDNVVTGLAGIDTETECMPEGAGLSHNGHINLT